MWEIVAAWALKLFPCCKPKAEQEVSARHDAIFLENINIHDSVIIIARKPAPDKWGVLVDNDEIQRPRITLT